MVSSPKGANATPTPSYTPRVTLKIFTWGYPTNLWVHLCYYSAQVLRLSHVNITNRNSTPAKSPGKHPNESSTHPRLIGQWASASLLKMCFFVQRLSHSQAAHLWKEQTNTSNYIYIMKIPEYTKDLVTFLQLANLQEEFVLLFSATICHGHLISPSQSVLTGLDGCGQLTSCTLGGWCLRYGSYWYPLAEESNHQKQGTQNQKHFKPS